jgi:hypothetical protein
MGWLGAARNDKFGLTTKRKTLKLACLTEFWTFLGLSVIPVKSFKPVKSSRNSKS